MAWPLGDSNESPNSQRGFSTVGGGNSNDYLPYVNYGKRLSGSSLVIVLSWEGTVLAQPCSGSPYTRAGWHSGRDSKGYLCIALDPLFCRAPSLPGTLPTNSSTLILPGRWSVSPQIRLVSPSLLHLGASFLHHHLETANGKSVGHSTS